MLESDKHEFAEIYRGICATYGREASKDAMRIAWGVLSAFDIGQVRQAYSAHVMTSKYMPTPAEIAALINASNPAMRRPGPDEAWARMPRSENDSVVWTDEMAYAWSIANGLVNPSLVEKPDWVAARMAFKDAYTRAIESAIAQGRPVNWQIVRGHTKDNLEDVLTEAMRLGLITHEQALPHLAELEHVRPMVAGLIEGTKGTANQEKAGKFLAGIKAMLTAPSPTYDLDAIRAECEAKDRELQQQGRQDAA